MKQFLFFMLLICTTGASTLAQNVSNAVTGMVKNENDEALSGVTVVARNAAAGVSQTTSTDDKGVFSFRGLPPGAGYQFIISYVGYQTDTLSGYDLKGDSRIALDVILQPRSTTLDQVVVIGYGSMRKSDLSAAVATVPGLEQAKNRPVLNVEGMMQGKVPGITIVNNGGHPNRGPSITIRGVGNRSGESPLYVVDGVPGAPFNPSDVESITVLKDAASAAIYGAFSGSAGVILITTRQAKEGKPTVEYSAFVGAKTAWKLPQSLTADKEAQVSNLAFENAGLPPLDGWNASINPYSQVTRTDWMGSIFRTGLVHRHNISINAGTDKFSTLFQGRYEENEGTLLNTFAKNLSGRFNAMYKFNNHVKFRQELFVNSGQSRGTETSSGYSGVILSGIYMPRSATVYYDDGSFGGVGPRESDYLGIHGDAINPVGTLLRNKSNNKAITMQSVSELALSNIFVRGLSFTSRFSYRMGNALNKNFSPRRLEPGKPNTSNQLDYSTERSHLMIWENTLNYTKTIEGHSIGLMVSSTALEDGARGFAASAKNFENESDWAQFFINAGNFTDNKPSDYDWLDRTQSYVGRVSYSWEDRYFVTGSYRKDNAGKLPLGFRAKGFPGITAAWKISSEPFFHADNVDLFKIRASWGRIGNINSVGRYYGYPTLGNGISYQVGQNAPQTNTLYVSAFTNRALTWETSEQKDIGVDLGLFDQRLTITVDYFDKLTKDLIKTQDNNWPNTFGFGAPLINQGEIRNTGFEFSATWAGKINKVNYDINGNFATLKNRVAYIDENPNSAWTHGDAWRGVLLPYRSVVGQPYYSYWLIQHAGIFQTQKEIDDYVGSGGGKIQPNAVPGDLKFIDENGDGKISDDDRVYMGNAFPKVTYGLTLNATWKNFDFSMFWQGVGGVKLFHAFKESTLNASEQGYNRWNKILEAWSPSNPGGTIPRISANDPNKNFQTPSDWYLENGDYLRLKSLIIGYNFPKLIKQSTLRVYISAENLITITKYTGMDPEVGGIGLDGGQFPVSRILSAGVRLVL